MFICQITGKLSAKGEKLEKVVVATRERTYTKWVRNEETREWEEVVIGKGYEIVRELNASQKGAASFAAMSPEDQALLVKSL
jgi:hypothetical protein